MSTTAALPQVKPKVPMPSEFVDDVTRQAKQVHPGRVIAAVSGGVLFTIGWLTAKLFGVLWFAAVWGALAAREGWRQAKGIPPSGPSLDAILTENARLRAEIARVS